jgi:RHS repeat-associated protein
MATSHTLPASVTAAIAANSTPRTSNKGTVEAIATTGHAAAGGILAYGAMAAGFAGGAALACFATSVVAPLAGAIAGAKIAQMVGADEWLLDTIGAERQAAPGPEVGHVTHKIAHNHAFLGAVAGLIVGALVGYVVAVAVTAAFGALVALSGGLALVLTPLVIGVVSAVAAGAAAGFVGGAIADAGAKAADITGTIIKGSPNVYFEGKPVARMTDFVECSRHPSTTPPPYIREGSATIFINSLPMARIGHKISCGAVIQEGCKTIKGDKTTTSIGESDAEFSVLQQAFLSVFEVLGMRSAVKKDGLLGSLLRKLFGDPIDVVTGDYADYRTDFEYSSVLPLSLARAYAGKNAVTGLLGTRWICNWSQRLVFQIEGGAQDGEHPTVLFEDAEGQRLVFALQKTEGRLLAVEFDSHHLKAPYYHLTGSREQTRIFDSRNQQTLVFELCKSKTAQGESVGRLCAIEDRNGNRIAFEYDSQSQHLRRVAHSDGAVFNITTTSQGLLARIERQGQHEPIVQYSYGHGIAANVGQNQLLTQIDGLYTGQFNFTYTPEGWLKTWADTGLTQFELTYDAAGRVVSTTSPDGTYNDRFEYAPDQRQSRYTDATGASTIFSYDANNLVTSETNPLGQTTYTEWDTLERKLSTTDALGRQTHFDYNHTGLCTKRTDHLERSSTVEYNAQGQVTSLTHASGAQEHWVYNATGNLTSHQSSEGQTIQYTYDVRGRLVKQQHGTDAGYSFDYNNFGQLVAQTDPAGHATRFEPDFWGRPLAITNALGHTTRYDYQRSNGNPRAALATLTHPDGAKEQFSYSSEGKLATHQGALGQTSHYLHGAFDMLRSSTDAAGQHTKYQYDACNRLTQITNPTGQHWRYQLDAAGQLAGETDWSGRQTRYVYDALGRLSAKQLPDDTWHRYSYDEYDQLTHIDAPRARISYQRTDPRHPHLVTRARTERIDQSGSSHEESDIQLVYDAQGRLVRELQNGASIAYSYSAQGQLSSRASASGTSHYQFDALGALTSLHSNGHAIDISRNALGQETQRSLHNYAQHQNQHKPGQHKPSAFLLQQTFDACQRLVTQQAGRYDAHSPLQQQFGTQQSSANRVYLHPNHSAQRRFSWDASSRLVGVQDNQHGYTQYHYDARDQTRHIERSYTGRSAKTNAQSGALGAERYNYDALQNISHSQIDQSGNQSAANSVNSATPDTPITTPITAHHYNGDTVSHIGNTKYEYDGRGRTIRKTVAQNGFRPQTWHYEWDDFDQLRQLRTPPNGTQSGQTWQYSYDAFGRRTHKRCLNPHTLSNNAYSPNNHRTAHGKQAPSYTTRYLWQGSRIVEQWRKVKADKAAAPQAPKTYADGTPEFTQTKTVPTEQITEHWQIDRWHYEPRSYQALAKESLLTQTELLSDSQLTELCKNINIDINSNSKLLNKHVGYSENSASKDISASNDDSFAFTPFNPSARADADTEADQPPLFASLLYPIVCDHLGTPKELYNAQGECVWQAQHSLWGKLSLVKSKSYNPTQAVIEQNAGSNDYKEDLDFQLPNHSCELRFAGQWFDAESGLHYNYNRYYDPNSGQYLSQDPIGLAGGMRTQAYVADPMHWVDPLGLAPCPASGSLDWSRTNPQGETAPVHVGKHGADVPNRTVPHGVFADDPVATTNAAWNNAVRDGVRPTVGNNGNLIYDIPHPNAGLQGGQPGAAAGNPILNNVRIVTTPSGNKVVTAHPI